MPVLINRFLDANALLRQGPGEIDWESLEANPTAETHQEHEPLSELFAIPLSELLEAPSSQEIAEALIYEKEKQMLAVLYEMIGMRFHSVEKSSCYSSS